MYAVRKANTRSAREGKTEFMMKGRIADEEARERLIRWIRRRMDEFGITPDALAESIEQDLAQRARFRDHRGNEWNGQGEMPTWLCAAQNAGVSPDFFRVDPTTHAATANSKVGPHQLDLFFSRPAETQQ
jgi:DNA-binding protein H-NS